MFGHDYSREDIERTLAPYMGAVSAVPAAKAAAGSYLENPPLFIGQCPSAVFKGVETTNLGAGISGPPKPKIDDVAKACPAVRKTLAEGGASDRQPVWHQKARLATFVENGRDALHRMSSRHAQYTAAENDSEYDRCLQDNATKALGWPSCKAFKDAGCTECATCPHLGAGKSPLHFAKPAAPAQAASAPTAMLPRVTAPAAGAARAKVKPGIYADPAQALADMNENYFVGDQDGEVAVYRIEDDGRLTYLRREDFELSLAHTSVLLRRANAKDKKIPITKFWREHDKRRQCRIVFDPKGKPGGSGAADIYNSWLGFGVEPKRGFLKVLSLLWHIYRVLCRGDNAKFIYTLQWCAWAVQRPDECAGAVIMLKGLAEGSGKTTMCEVMRKLFGLHGRLIDNRDHLIGKFNAHLEFTCFAQCDEILFAGDGKTSDILKSRVTARDIPIEQKFRAVRQVPSRLHVMMTSNHEHAVAAGAAARRFFVVDVSDEFVGNKPYFDRLYNDLNAGGYEEFLWLLQNLNLGNFHPQRHMPRTEELAVQQLMSAGSIEQWLQTTAEHERLASAQSLGGGDIGRDIPTHELSEAYVAFTRARGMRPETQVQFGRVLTKLFGLRRQIRDPHDNKKRVYAYTIPDAAGINDALRRRLGIGGMA